MKYIKKFKESLVNQKSLDQFKRIRKLSKGIDIGDRVTKMKGANLAGESNFIDDNPETIEQYYANNKNFKVNQNTKNFVREALETKCQTPGAIFNTKIEDSEITSSVKLPFTLELTTSEAKTLESNIHNVLELVLSPYFINIDKNLNESVQGLDFNRLVVAFSFCFLCSYLSSGIMVNIDDVYNIIKDKAESHQVTMKYEDEHYVLYCSEHKCLSIDVRIMADLIQNPTQFPVKWARMDPDKTEQYTYFREFIMDTCMEVIEKISKDKMYAQ